MPFEEVTIGPCRLIRADCMEVLPTLGIVDAVVTDPPYGMKKADWDQRIPEWLHLVGPVPIATFCGVIGMRDYPPADWTGAWVRQGSTQRNGRLRGFNNWEPILFYNLPKLLNDVLAFPNYHEDTGHPTTKPLALMRRLVELMPGHLVLDPFCGSGTTLVAAMELGRSAIGIEREPRYFDIACRRIEEAWGKGSLFDDERKPEAELFSEDL